MVIDYVYYLVEIHGDPPPRVDQRVLLGGGQGPTRPEGNQEIDKVGHLLHSLDEPQWFLLCLQYKSENISSFPTLWEMK